jgi:hypothetical protein
MIWAFLNVIKKPKKENVYFKRSILSGGYGKKPQNTL